MCFAVCFAFGVTIGLVLGLTVFGEDFGLVSQGLVFGVTIFGEDFGLVIVCFAFGVATGLDGSPPSSPLPMVPPRGVPQQGKLGHANPLAILLRYFSCQVLLVHGNETMVCCSQMLTMVILCRRSQARRFGDVSHHCDETSVEERVREGCVTCDMRARRACDVAANSQRHQSQSRR